VTVSNLPPLTLYPPSTISHTCDTRTYTFTSNIFSMSGTLNVSKIAAERNQKALQELAAKPGNGELSSLRHILCTGWPSFCFFGLSGPATILSGHAGHGASLAGQPLTADLQNPSIIADFAPPPRFSRHSQIYVPTVRHGIRDGPLTILGFSFGTCFYFRPSG
jgi:hypothetical protein